MAKLRRITGLEELHIELQGIFDRLSALVNHYYKLAENKGSGTVRGNDGLMSCMGHLRSLGNVMLLVRLPEAQVFCRTLEDVCHRLVAKNRPDALLCETLGFGVIMLQRYIDFVTREQLSVPPLVIPFVNDVRRSLGKKPIEEGFFTRLSLQELAKCNELPPKEPDISMLVRCRHGYQRGLIFVLRGDRREEGLFIMKKSVASLISIYHHSPFGVFWNALGVVLTGMAQGWLRMTPHRREVLSQVDRVLYRLNIGELNSQSLLQVKSILRDLLFLSALCRDYHAAADVLAKTFGLDDVHFDDSFLAHQHRLLLGPDAETYITFFDRISDLITDIRRLTTRQIGAATIENRLGLCALFASARSLFTVLEATSLCTEIKSVEHLLANKEWSDEIAGRVVELLVSLEHDIGYRQLVLKPNDYINRARPDLIQSKSVSAFFLVSAQKTLLEEVLFELQKIISAVERVEHTQGLKSVDWPAVATALHNSANVLALIDLTDFSRSMGRVARNLTQLIEIQLVHDRVVMEYWATGLAALEYYCAGLLSPKELSQKALAMINPTLKDMWVYIAKRGRVTGVGFISRPSSSAVDNVRLAELG